jgi:hypothetical protein
MDVFTVDEFKGCVKDGLFTDYDGFGNPMKDGLVCDIFIVKPSELHNIPEDTTHIIWYNR